MTTLEHVSTVDRVRAIGAELAGRADEFEAARTLPRDVVDTVSAAGCFRALVPRRYGGDELTLPQHLELIEELARIDGSLGWTIALGSAAPALLGHLPPATFEAMYATSPDVVGAGTFNPTGRASPVAGGYTVSGRWSFASGCQHAHWFLAHCVVTDGRTPPLRMMVVPAPEVSIIDTWTTLGMCGTGSHDFSLADVYVPEERTFSIFESPALDVPLLRVPELCLSSMVFAAVAVGIAVGARAEVAELATGKVTLFADSVLAANPLFRNQLGHVDAALRAARALLQRDAVDVWERAMSGGTFDDDVRARLRSSTTWIVETATAVVDAAYLAGGGTAIYRSSPLQRRLRDIHTLTQHFAIKPDTYTLAGAVLAGQSVDTSFL